MIVFPLAFALSIVLGRATRLSDSDVSLVWPAAAVSIIWLLAIRGCGRSELAVHVVSFAAVTFVANRLTGASMPLSAWAIVINLSLAVVAVRVLTYRREEASLRDPSDLARLVLAVAAGSSCAALLATAYLVPISHAPGWQTFGLIAVRNSASALIGVAIWLRLGDVTWNRPRVSMKALVETLLVGSTIAAVFIWVFLLNTGVPMAFLTFVPATWVALRYSTTASTVFLTVAGILIIGATLLDKGVFVVSDLHIRALLAQALIWSLTVVVLTLALYRDSRVELVAQLRQARDLFAGVLQAASEQAIIGTDPDGRITVFNNGAERLLGWTAEEMIGRTPMDFHHYPEVSARADELGVAPGFEVFVHNVTSERAEVREWTYVRRDGTHMIVNLAVSRMTEEDGRCAGYIGVATNITDRKAAEHALAESEERFRLAFDTALMGMFMFEVTQEHRGRITRCNRAMADILGRSEADVLGLRVTDLGDAERDFGTGGLNRLLTLRVGEQFEAETPFTHADGHQVWGSVSASVVAPAGSHPYGICLVEDVTGRMRVEAELQHLAQHDQLTGLVNRAVFAERIEKSLEHAGPGDRDAVGLIFLDLDGFKIVNDTWGHAQGDEILQTAARRIVASIRRSDTAARLGGDEFAVLCPGVSEPALRRMAERIRAELHRPFRLAVGGTYDRLSVSAGVVTSRPGCTTESLLQRADMLMYHAKRNGKDCVTTGEPAEEAAMLRAVRLIRELDTAKNYDNFVVHFQPIVELRTGEFVAAEALLRWHHPEWGLLKPDEFLSTVESSAYMPAIGRHVLFQACQAAQLWTGPMTAATVHVNVSGRQLEVGDFHADVLDALAQTRLRPERLVLELTETYAGRVPASARAAWEQLRRIGVRIAIDDVGTGFSGLVKIVDLPIDILKIDKQFIAGLPHDPRCEAITKAVLGLGTSLGLSVFAEGIELQSQCDQLAEWGCEFGQGFLFGHAMKSADLNAAASLRAREPLRPA